jgi:hypothetical protein
VTASFSGDVIVALCFFDCVSLEWVGFESGSQLQRIERFAFADTLSQKSDFRIHSVSQAVVDSTTNC